MQSHFLFLGFRVLYKMSTIVTFVFLLLSIAVIIALTLIQLNNKEILSPGRKVSSESVLQFNLHSG